MHLFVVELMVEQLSTLFRAVLHVLAIGPSHLGRPAVAWAFAACMLLNFSTLHGQSGATQNQFETSAQEAQSAGEYQDALLYLDSARKSIDRRHDTLSLSRILVKKAILFQILSQYDMALEQLYSARTLRSKYQDTLGLAEVNNNIGAIYHTQKDYSKASEYYKITLTLYEQIGDQLKIAQTYNNIGALLEDMKDPVTALEFHRKSLSIWQNEDQPKWIGISFQHLGVCYSLLEKFDSARFYLEECFDFMESWENRSQMSNTAILLGNVHMTEGSMDKAIEWCELGLAIAEERGWPLYQQRGCKCLHEAYEAIGSQNNALTYYKQFVSLRDSIFSQEQAKEITRLEMDHTFSQKQLADSLIREEEKLRIEMAHQKEVSNKEKSRNIFMASGVILLLLAGGLWSRMRLVRRAKSRIEREKDRSENLLLNILPAEIAEELKEKGRAEARDFEKVTILFTDFKGFTSVAEKLSPQALVAEINACFEAFDHLIGKYNIEKIKTIGDAYMAAGGLPVPSDESIANCLLAAIEMQEFMEKRKEERDAQKLPAFEMRVGMHTGPVVAGIVGVKKFQYDVWGDTVNTASRMESSGSVGQVNLSESTYLTLAEDPRFKFEFRGMIQAKGKGEMNMYFASLAD
jgi:adenylate cyclase